MTITPNPGSVAAQQLGCTCPIMDNAYGRGIPGINGPLFWFNEACPVHSPPPARTEREKND